MSSVESVLPKQAQFETNPAAEFFAGVSAKDIALALKTTEATVQRDWTIARAWLHRRLEGEAAS